MIGRAKCLGLSPVVALAHLSPVVALAQLEDVFMHRIVGGILVLVLSPAVAL